VGAFAMFPSVLDQRFQVNGTTPLGPSVMYSPTVTDLQTPRSRTWDLGFDYRFNSAWSMHVGMLDRQRRAEPIVNPVVTGPATGQLLLSSSGNSSYLGGDVNVHFSAGQRADFNVTYTRSRARADLNAMSNYFDTIMWPVLGRDEYAPAVTDAPNRLLARGRFMPWKKWLVLRPRDWGNRFPWAPTTGALRYVLPRHPLQLPPHFPLEPRPARQIQP